MLAVAVYDVVKALHIMAVVAAFGLPLAYPLLLGYAQQKHPRSMGAIHDTQLWLNQRVTGTGTVLILLFGAYLASKEDLWGEIWVTIPFVILIIIGGVGGALINPAVRKLSEIASRDISRSDAPGGAVTLSDEYTEVYRRYIQYEILLGVLVLVAIFVMTTKP